VNGDQKRWSQKSGGQGNQNQGDSDAFSAEIYLIRHGRTEANAGRLYCGSSDIPLSADGVAEITRLKDEGIYPHYVDLCFTSGMLRTVETMGIIYGSKEELDGTIEEFDGSIEAPSGTAASGHIVLTGLQEYHFGFFEMQSYEMLKDRGDYQAWIADETGGVSCPGGESRNQFNKRVTEAFVEILSHIGVESRMRERRRAAVFTHGGVITSIMDHLWPGTRGFYEWQPEPGRGYALVYEDRQSRQYRLI